MREGAGQISRGLGSGPGGSRLILLRKIPELFFLGRPRGQVGSKRSNGKGESNQRRRIQENIAKFGRGRVAL